MVKNNFKFNQVSLIVKTLRNYERVAAKIIEEKFPETEVLANPLNYSGLVLVKSKTEAEKLAVEIKTKVPEAEKVLPVKEYTNANLDSIVKSALKFSSLIAKTDSFAVKTVRRGKHNFTSIEVNIKVGAALKEATGCKVDLDNPEKVVFIEILGSHAYLGVVDGKEFPKKKMKGKFEVRPYFRKVAIVQMPYLGGIEVAKQMGIRIGREVQTFEVGELIIAPIGKVKAEEMNVFLKGIFKGIESRYNIQTKTYAHKPYKTEVYIQNLYELVRERSNEPIIVFEPEGKPINKIAEKLAELTIKNKRVNLLLGSREGIPSGIFRFADLVIDLCPGITIATDLAAASALTALAYAVHEKISKDNKN